MVAAPRGSGHDCCGSRRTGGRGCWPPSCTAATSRCGAARSGSATTRCASVTHRGRNGRPGRCPSSWRGTIDRSRRCTSGYRDGSRRGASSTVFRRRSRLRSSRRGRRTGWRSLVAYMASKPKTKAGRLESEIDGLYALPLDEFTAARDELARRLRGDGDREAAGEVKALRKPTLAAWALNHVRHNEPGRVKDLLTAGNKLQKAQAQLVSGGKPDQLREAAAAERQMVDDVVALAEKALADPGHAVAPVLRTKRRTTAHAAAVSPEAGGVLEVGRLITDHEASDLGRMGGGAALVSREREPAKRAPAKRRGPPERQAGKREEAKREAA